MFARILEFTPKMEKKNEFIKKVHDEVLPVLRQQPGFLELMPFDPEIAEKKAVVITLWSEKHHVEQYVKEVFPKVEKIIKPFLTTAITVRMFRVETTLCEHLVDALTTAA